MIGIDIIYPLLDRIASAHLEDSKWLFQQTILGEPASKANSRRIVRFKATGKIMSIKSSKALAYVKGFTDQAISIDPLIEKDVLLFCNIFYRTRRPDLDESLICDLLQGVAYKNDRQVKMKIICHSLDKENPRADIRVGVLVSP